MSTTQIIIYCILGLLAAVHIGLGRKYSNFIDTWVTAQPWPEVVEEKVYLILLFLPAIILAILGVLTYTLF